MATNIRTIVAICLSLAVLLLWQVFFTQTTHKKSIEERRDITRNITTTYNRDAIIAMGKQKKLRIPFRNRLIEGSINLKGAKIDDLTLLTYNQSNTNSKVHLLSPVNTKGVYYIEFGWLTFEKKIELPNTNTIWSADKEVLQNSERINLTWYNQKGTKFIISLFLDQHYMFTIEQFILGENMKSVKGYSALTRSSHQIGKNEMLIHEGGIGVLDNRLSEISFSDLNKKLRYNFKGKHREWFGFSDKYWLAAIIPTSNCNVRFISHQDHISQRYQADVIYDHTFANDKTKNNYQKFLFYVGAKKLKILDFYMNKYDIKLFDRAVDFGILYFITKPIFLTLNFFYSLVGNFGVAILLLTVFFKLLLFPLAYKGFVGMNKIKDLHPEIKRLKCLYNNDQVQLQKAILTLYRQEKINPMSGCLPAFLQMPVFFALYKVLYITIEMRQAPFFGWIKDLSVSDPTNIFNLFGLLSWEPPSFMHIGVLPIIMSGTLILQQSLNPQSTDLAQVKIIKFIPFIFLFMFSSFPSGLILYWSWSNILSLIQQMIIKHISK